MNLEHLRNFIEVCEEMNISAAARRLRLTQPALSRQMAVFENDTGWELFRRGAKSIKLTRAGEVVRRLGIELIGRVDHAELQMRREIEGEEIRVGYAPSLGSDILQLAMARFSQLHAQVRVSLLDSSGEEMINGLRDGGYDLVIGVSRDDPDFEWVRLRQESFVTAVPENHPLARKRFIRPADLDGRKLLLLSRADYPGYWREVMAYFRQHGINAKVAGEFDGISSLRLGLEAGLGVALVAERAQTGKQVKIKKMTPSPDPICVGAGYRKGRELTPSMMAFITELEAAAAGQSETSVNGQNHFA